MIGAETFLLVTVGVATVAAARDICLEPDPVPRMVALLIAALAHDAGRI